MFTKITSSLENITPVMISDWWLWKWYPSKDGKPWLQSKKAGKSTKYSNCLVWTQVLLADGTEHAALIWGIDLDAPEFSKHNRELYLWINSYGWFQLAQYWDNEAIKNIRWNEVLCGLLNKSLDSIFPIYFNLQNIMHADSPCLTGFFEHHPIWAKSESEIMEILVHSLV